MQRWAGLGRGGGGGSLIKKKNRLFKFYSDCSNLVIFGCETEILKTKNLSVSFIKRS